MLSNNNLIKNIKHNIYIYIYKNKKKQKKKRKENECLPMAITPLGEGGGLQDLSMAPPLGWLVATPKPRVSCEPPRMKPGCSLRGHPPPPKVAATHFLSFFLLSFYYYLFNFKLRYFSLFTNLTDGSRILVCKW
jgi:hypothetical protein